MNFKFKMRLPQQIGLDIGNRTLKALKLVKKGTKVHLDRYFFCDMADSSPKFPVVSALDETLRGLVEVAGFKNLSVASCVDDSEIMSFDLVLPSMPKEDLVAAVAGEIEPKINFPLEEASTDFVIVDRTKVDGDEMLTIKAYCARLGDIKIFVELLQSARLKPESLDIAMLSNIAMLDFNSYLVNDSYMAIVDLGESKTNLALVKGNSLVVANSLPTSLGLINRRLHEATGMSYLDAEKIKIQSSQKNEQVESKVGNIVDGVYLELFQNLQRTMEFFRSNTGGKPLAKILVLGGGAQYSSVLSTIEATCGAEAVVANPFRNIEIFSKGKENNDKIAELAPQMGTAVGLALRGINVG